MLQFHSELFLVSASSQIGLVGLHLLCRDDELDLTGKEARTNSISSNNSFSTPVKSFAAALDLSRAVGNLRRGSWSGPSAGSQEPSPNLVNQLLRRQSEVINSLEIFTDTEITEVRRRSIINSSTPTASPPRIITPSTSFQLVPVISRNPSFSADPRPSETEVFEEDEAFCNKVDMEEQLSNITKLKEKIRRKRRTP